MHHSLVMSLEEKEQLFLSELVRCGVKYDTALQVAALLAAEKSDEQLNVEELQMMQEACKLWLQQRQRHSLISQVLESIPVLVRSS